MSNMVVAWWKWSKKSRKKKEKTPCSWGRSDWLHIYWWLSAGSQGSAAQWFAALRETDTDRSIQRKHENSVRQTAQIPSLQRRPNQTWAIWKWPSETSAWILLLISQHACWSTPQSTATRGETDKDEPVISQKSCIHDYSISLWRTAVTRTLFQSSGESWRIRSWGISSFRILGMLGKCDLSSSNLTR